MVLQRVADRRRAVAPAARPQHRAAALVDVVDVGVVQLDRALREVREARIAVPDAHDPRDPVLARQAPIKLPHDRVQPRADAAARHDRRPRLAGAERDAAPRPRAVEARLVRIRRRQADDDLRAHEGLLVDEEVVVGHEVHVRALGAPDGRREGLEVRHPVPEVRDLRRSHDRGPQGRPAARRPRDDARAKRKVPRVLARRLARAPPRSHPHIVLECLARSSPAPLPQQAVWRSSRIRLGILAAFLNRVCPS